MIVSRQKLLDAAMRVFAESGFRGATTRRIAEAAGVNEVTLFRQFHSKTALINEAAQLYARRRSEFALPAVPSDPLPELAEWCTTQLKFLRRTRALIRKCMAELEEHPQMATCMRHGPDVAHAQLLAFATQVVKQQALPVSRDDLRAACSMLQGALFSDAMGRDMMPDLFPRPLRTAGAQYARSFLRALGAAIAPPGGRNGVHPPATRPATSGRGDLRAPRSRRT